MHTCLMDLAILLYTDASSYVFSCEALKTLPTRKLKITTLNYIKNVRTYSCQFCWLNVTGKNFAMSRQIYSDINIDNAINCLIISQVFHLVIIGC